MNKVFLSLPMSGRTDEEIRNDILRMENLYLETFAKSEEAKDVTKFFENFTGSKKIYSDEEIEDIKELPHPNLAYLGAAIAIMSVADEVLFAEDWDTARGCCVEYEVCCAYDIPCWKISREGKIERMSHERTF